MKCNLHSCMLLVTCRWCLEGAGTKLVAVAKALVEQTAR